MDVWSKYRKHGLWGLWVEAFSIHGPWSVVVRFAGINLAVQGNPPALVEVPQAENTAFSWKSPNGLELEIFAPVPPGATEAESWRLLLYYEAVNQAGRQTFLPLWPATTGALADLNALCMAPGSVLLFNGQPGVGKRGALLSLCLLHHGRVPDLAPQALNHWQDLAQGLWVVPEVAMLELGAQQQIVKGLGAGEMLWAATAYDLDMLRNRKILNGAFVDRLVQGRVHLPPVSRREASDIDSLVRFWQALYGEGRVAAQANLEFLKQRSVAGAQLSVGSILEEGSGLRGVIAEFEKEAIRQAHARVGRSQHKIARLLKVSRGSLQHKLRKYQLESYTSADADTEEGD